MIPNLHAKLGLLKLFLKHIFQVNNKLYLQLHRQFSCNPFQIDSMIRFKFKRRDVCRIDTGSKIAPFYYNMSCLFSDFREISSLTPPNAIGSLPFVMTISVSTIDVLHHLKFSLSHLFSLSNFYRLRTNLFLIKHV